MPRSAPGAPALRSAWPAAATAGAGSTLPQRTGLHPGVTQARCVEGLGP
jgi:hypothetical protein